jgi:hypothetical protein
MDSLRRTRFQIADEVGEVSIWPGADEQVDVILCAVHGERNKSAILTNSPQVSAEFGCELWMDLRRSLLSAEDDVRQQLRVGSRHCVARVRELGSLRKANPQLTLWATHVLAGFASRTQNGPFAAISARLKADDRLSSRCQFGPMLKAADHVSDPVGGSFVHYNKSFTTALLCASYDRSFSHSCW